MPLAAGDGGGKGPPEKGRARAADTRGTLMAYGFLRQPEKIREVLAAAQTSLRMATSAEELEKAIGLAKDVPEHEWNVHAIACCMGRGFPQPFLPH